MNQLVSDLLSISDFIRFSLFVYCRKLWAPIASPIVFWNGEREGVSDFPDEPVDLKIEKLTAASTRTVLHDGAPRHEDLACQCRLRTSSAELSCLTGRL